MVLPREEPRGDNLSVLRLVADGIEGVAEESTVPGLVERLARRALGHPVPREVLAHPLEERELRRGGSHVLADPVLEQLPQRAHPTVGKEQRARRRPLRHEETEEAEKLLDAAPGLHRLHHA